MLVHILICLSCGITFDMVCSIIYLFIYAYDFILICEHSHVITLQVWYVCVFREFIVLENLDLL
uniref:Putative ovule protein n=1 Tax=Solanum chacoense TaxID=4108 RepID=A0A0V0GYI2_SOLCH